MFNVYIMLRTQFVKNYVCICKFVLLWMCIFVCFVNNFIFSKLNCICIDYYLCINICFLLKYVTFNYIMIRYLFSMIETLKY